MKELIKPKIQELVHVITSLCEADCQCPHVLCNKDCYGPDTGPNTSVQQDEDLLF